MNPGDGCPLAWRAILVMMMMKMMGDDGMDEGAGGERGREGSVSLILFGEKEARLAA
jgi:hypothetical protein